MQDEKKVFSSNLNHYMNLNGKTQNDIVMDLGLNKSTVSTWCNGLKIPRMDKIQALADYFGIMKSDLIENKPTADSNRLTKHQNDLYKTIMSLNERDQDATLEFIEFLKSKRNQ